MADSSFLTQADALLRKSLVFQKRNIWTNIRLIAIPFFLCILLVVIQLLFDTQFNDVYGQCGCICNDTNGDGNCEKLCGVKYSTSYQAAFCAFPNPTEWPPLLQIPALPHRAVRLDSSPYADLPMELCKKTGSCPITTLVTGDNQSLGEILSEKMYSSSTLNPTDFSENIANYVLGSSGLPAYTDYQDSGVISDIPIYNIQRECKPNSSFSIILHQSSLSFPKEINCVEGLYLWRNSSSDVNEELYKGYQKGNRYNKINEYSAAFDFKDTDTNNLNVHVWYNATYKNDTGETPITLTRVPRLINMASNAYLEFLRGVQTRMQLEFVKEMPKPETKLRLDVASLIGPLFYTWVILLLFPVILTTLVYEKQQRLRIMMKMHGLGDGPYWIISYAYFLLISMLYMICFALFGSAIGLNFFRLNSYSIQLVFFFICINLQISIAFMASAMFSSVKTATVVSYIFVFGTGLLGIFLFQFFLEDTLFPRSWIIVMELYPGFSLYRGLYELSQFAFAGDFRGGNGMRWRDFDSSMKEITTIMLIEWLLVLILAYYIDQIVYSGKHPLYFLPIASKKSLSLWKMDTSKVLVEMENPDVRKEREKVEQLMFESTEKHAIICNNMKKVYHEKDGNPTKIAVRGLSLVLPQGECFGMLGPNGAGKTSFINMMTGIIKPSSGTAFVQGLSILTDMNKIYTSIGICPQHDLLWETLTGTEHLLFYGRLKNLKGPVLTQAVEESLGSVRLLHGGVADKKVGQYSGGMKRRLSVAISLIGNPKVVYMDEPSTGLDPASRKSLWNVVKQAKHKAAIILTTHSMEEAEVLCDRLGIFVDGNLQCLGNPKELKGRYGGSYVFTITTSPEHEGEVENIVCGLSEKAKKIYQISGTQKFELPKHEVKMADVFQTVEIVKNSFTVFAWGLADTTLEDVFVRVAQSAQIV